MLANNNHKSSSWLGRWHVCRQHRGSNCSWRKQRIAA